MCVWGKMYGSERSWLIECCDETVKTFGDGVYAPLRPRNRLCESANRDLFTRIPNSHRHVRAQDSPQYIDNTDDLNVQNGVG